MVSAKGMWLSDGFPLESKCYQSCDSVTGEGMLWLFIIVEWIVEALKDYVYTIRVR